jgi:hypothetical protein
MAPIAVLTSACAATEPWTPAVSVQGFAEEPPLAPMTALPSTRSMLERWQLPATSPWAPYVKTTLLSAPSGGPAAAELPDFRTLEVVSRAEAAAQRLARVGVPRDVLFVVDLRGAASVAFAAALSKAAREPIAPIATFHNWPNDAGMIPAEETLAALVNLSPRAPLPPGDAVPVMMLDSWRLSFRFDAPPDDTVDNRYALVGADFPDADALRKNGIARVIYLAESLDDVATEEDDVHDAALAWQRAGIPVSLVDLSWLEERAEPIGSVDLDDTLLVVAPRAIVLRDPAFYARARGGFGGVYTGATAPHVRAGVSLGSGIGGGSWGHGGG